MNEGVFYFFFNMKVFCYVFDCCIIICYPQYTDTRTKSMFVHQDVSYDIMMDERFAIAIWFALCKSSTFVFAVVPYFFHLILDCNYTCIENLYVSDNASLYFR